MVEVLAGIWLFLLTAAAGFVCGRYSRKGEKHTPSRKRKSVHADGEIGWRELMNFLQYDGSGKLPSGNFERGELSGETEDYTGTGAERIYRRRPL